MPDAKPMSPERLAAIELLLRLPARDASDGLRQGVLELIAEIRRLQPVVDRLATLERDLAEANLALEKQDHDTDQILDRMVLLEVSLREAYNWITDRTDNGSDFADRLLAIADSDVAGSHGHGMRSRIAALEAGLREACDGWLSLWTSDYNEDPPDAIDRLRAIADGDVTTKETK